MSNLNLLLIGISVEIDQVAETPPLPPLPFDIWVCLGQPRMGGGGGGASDTLTCWNHNSKLSNSPPA